MYENLINSTSKLEWARFYVHEKKFSVIPAAPKTKRPILKWEEYLKRLPTDEELLSWFTSGTNEIAILTGAFSNLVVIDFDRIEAFEKFQSNYGIPTTPKAITGKGVHIYCRFHEGVRNWQKKADLPDIDLRGEGGCIIAPPSLHVSYDETGKIYRWDEGHHIVTCEIANLPDIIIHLSNKAQAKTPQKHSQNIPRVTTDIKLIHDKDTSIDVINNACDFMNHCYHEQESLSEILWYSMITNLCRIHGGEELVHDYSCGYPNYSHEETEQKITHAMNDTGPHTCEFIKQHYDCGRDCGVTSPIIRIKEHLLSASIEEEIEESDKNNYKQIFTLIECLQDSVKQEEYVKSLAEHLGVNASSIKKEFNKITRRNSNILDEYYAMNEKGFFCKYVKTGKGVNVTKLANFQAQITKEITEDNGSELSLLYEVEGKSKFGMLPVLSVPAEIFNSLNWVQKWGSRAVIEPGYSVKDTLRHGIQLSSDAERITCYTHTGWRDINGTLVYMTSSGAIGKENVTVNLAKDLQRYCLPQTIENETEAIKTALSFLEIADKEVMLPLFAYLFLAPLTTILKMMPNFVLYVYGVTGSQKSTIAVLMLGFFGKFNYIYNLSNFGDTKYHLLERAFTLKDTLMVVDDYHPSASRKDSEYKKETFLELVRQVSNRTGRGRLNPNATEKDRHEPRCLLMVTGEDLLAVPSALARIFTVETKRRDVDLNKLTELQSKAHLLPHAMASYIRWVQDNMNNVKEWFNKLFNAFRKKAYEQSKHAKLPEQVAFLQFGMSVALQWMKEKGIVSQEECTMRMKDSWNTLMNLSEKQSQRIEQEDPVTKFYEILETLLMQEKVRINDKYESKAIVGIGSNDLIGYYDYNKEWIYLIPQAIWNVLQKFCNSENTHFPVGKETLLKMLLERGCIRKYGDQNTSVTKIKNEQGVMQSKRIIQLKMSDTMKEVISMKCSIEEFVANPEIMMGKN